MDKRILVYTDSFNFWHNIDLYRAGIINNVPFADTVNMDLYNHINIGHNNRKYNLGADNLAKQGANKPNSISGWV